ncbi:MAG TPA: hypothetical protein VGS08_04585 [Candidatus Saccharimonadales bacterium]|nr:hypothetical protein [Candidatus Saccharimonadales bacterium]
MQPDQTQPPAGHNPYDFIMNSGKPVKHPLGTRLPAIGGSSFGKQLAVLIGGVVVLMGIIGGTISLFGNKGITPQLISLAATQNEIIHIATKGSGMVTNQGNQALAIDVELTVQTQQKQLLAYLSKLGTTVSSKQLTLQESTQIDSELTGAQNNSTQDMVFAQIIQQQLQSYADTVKQLFYRTSNADSQHMLAVDYQQTELLLKQIPPTASLQG